jgi:hypothetical protein
MYFRIHDPQAVLDYGLRWTAWLAVGETITAFSWTLPTGITLVDQDCVAGVITVWISCATEGLYTIVGRITTSQGRTDERSIRIKVSNR